INGSTRWIIFGPISFQPSDVAKIALVIALAAFLSERHDEMGSLLNFFLSGLIVALPFGLVFIQPDLGSSLVFAFVWFMVLLLSKARVIYLLSVALATIPAGFIAWQFILHDYQ